ncbi:MAG TPA: hypothetical protein DIU00_07220 [Phycisphaerales bacterium]|nr:hypothetical protein [Phycisphaerales bacterium]
MSKAEIWKSGLKIGVFISVNSWFRPYLKKQSQFYCVEFSVLRAPWESLRTAKGNLKKQSQFSDGQIKRKVLFERSI